MYDDNIMKNIILEVLWQKGSPKFGEEMEATNDCHPQVGYLSRLADAVMGPNWMMSVMAWWLHQLPWNFLTIPSKEFPIVTAFTLVYDA